MGMTVTVALCAAALLAACTPLRSTSDTRYQGILLDGRNLGAGELRREAAADPTIAQYVAQHGAPDFILTASPRDVQLIYTWRRVLAYFRRPAAGEPSAVAEVSPLPSGLLQMLPADIRAGTGEPLRAAGPSCWTVEVADASCRTCCMGPGACSVDCTRAAR